MEKKENLLDVVAILFKWKKFIIVTVGAAAIISAIVSLVLPVYYKATTVFYAASPDLAVPESIFGNSSQAPKYYGTESDINRLMSIANSNELANFMIDSFNLYQHYDITPRSSKEAHAVRLKFKKHFKALKTKYDAIELSVEDRDKELAARMANAAREFINLMGQQLIKAGQEKILRTYIDNIQSKEQGLQILNDSLQKVRETYGVYNHLAQTEVMTEMISKAEAKLFNSQAKLDALKNNRHFKDSVAILKANIAGYEHELDLLRKRLDTFNLGMTKVETMKSAQSEIIEKLSEDKERYKQLKAAYESEFPAVLLMEPATIPLIKERPKRMIIVTVSTIAALVFSVLGVVVFETYKNTDWQQILGNS